MSSVDQAKQIPDSQVIFQKKRIGDIEDLSATKFGKALIQVSVNRKEECFDVLVTTAATEGQVKEFECMWPMCKVQIFKPVPRKRS